MIRELLGSQVPRKRRRRCRSLPLNTRGAPATPERHAEPAGIADATLAPPPLGLGGMAVTETPPAPEELTHPPAKTQWHQRDKSPPQQPQVQLSVQEHPLLPSQPLVWKRLHRRRTVDGGDAGYSGSRRNWHHGRHGITDEAGKATASDRMQDEPCSGGAAHMIPSLTAPRRAPVPGAHPKQPPVKRIHVPSSPLLDAPRSSPRCTSPLPSLVRQFSPCRLSTRQELSRRTVANRDSLNQTTPPRPLRLRSHQRRSSRSRRVHLSSPAGLPVHAMVARSPGSRCEMRASLKREPPDTTRRNGGTEVRHKKARRGRDADMEADVRGEDRSLKEKGPAPEQRGMGVDVLACKRHSASDPSSGRQDRISTQVLQTRQKSSKMKKTEALQLEQPLDDIACSRNTCQNVIEDTSRRRFGSVSNNLDVPDPGPSEDRASHQHGLELNVADSIQVLIPSGISAEGCRYHCTCCWPSCRLLVTKRSRG